MIIGRGVLKNPWLIRDAARLLAGKESLPQPTPDELEAFRNTHYARMVEIYEKPYAEIIFRKWKSKYIRWTSHKGH